MASLPPLIQAAIPPNLTGGSTGLGQLNQSLSNLNLGGASAGLGMGGGLGLSSLGGLGMGGLSGLAGNAGTPIGAAGQQGQGPEQILQLLVQLLTMVLGQATGQGTPSFDRSAPAGANDVSTFGNAPVAVRDVAPGNIDTSDLGANNATLQANLDKIAQDPEGAKLLAEAQRQGLSIEVGDPGGPNVQGVAISRGNSTKIIVRDPNNVKTIVHELVHAATSQDGNSQHEEGIADTIGYRVAERVTGNNLTNKSEQQIYTDKKKLYRELGATNSVESTLGNIGIQAFA